MMSPWWGGRLWHAGQLRWIAGLVAMEQVVAGSFRRRSRLGPVAARSVPVRRCDRRRPGGGGAGGVAGRPLAPARPPALRPPAGGRAGGGPGGWRPAAWPRLATDVVDQVGDRVDDPRGQEREPPGLLASGDA